MNLVTSTEDIVFLRFPLGVIGNIAFLIFAAIYFSGLKLAIKKISEMNKANSEYFYLTVVVSLVSILATFLEMYNYRIRMFDYREILNYNLDFFYFQDKRFEVLSRLIGGFVVNIVKYIIPVKSEFFYFYSSYLVTFFSLLSFSSYIYKSSYKNRMLKSIIGLLAIFCLISVSWYPMRFTHTLIFGTFFHILIYESALGIILSSILLSFERADIVLLANLYLLVTIKNLNIKKTIPFIVAAGISIIIPKIIIYIVGDPSSFNTFGANGDRFAKINQNLLSLVYVFLLFFPFFLFLKKDILNLEKLKMMGIGLFHCLMISFLADYSEIRLFQLNFAILIYILISLVDKLPLDLKHTESQ